MAIPLIGGALKFLGSKALPWLGKLFVKKGVATGLTKTLISSGVSGALTSKMQKQNYANDKRMYDYQNAYNTPAMQMARLKEAGLNPALMYSQGNVGNASNYPKSNLSGAEIAQSAATGAQISLVNSQRANIDADTEIKLKDAGLKNEDIAIRKIEREILEKTKADQIKSVTEQLELLVSQKKISQADEAFALYKERLSNKGINVNDPIIYRVISQIINLYFPQFSEEMSNTLTNEINNRK